MINYNEVNEYVQKLKDNDVLNKVNNIPSVYFYNPFDIANSLSNKSVNVDNLIIHLTNKNYKFYNIANELIDIEKLYSVDFDTGVETFTGYTIVIAGNTIDIDTETDDLIAALNNNKETIESYTLTKNEIIDRLFPSAPIILFDKFEGDDSVDYYNLDYDTFINLFK